MAEHTPAQGEYFFLPQEHIIYGPGSLASLADEVRRLAGKRAFIITGQSLATQTDVVSKVERALGPLHAGTFTGIRQHTPKSDVALAARQAQSVYADVLVSVGGGSPIDATKAVALSLLDERGIILTHIAIPTTLSAAEFSHLVGVTDEDTNMKTGFAHTQAAPRSVLLDAELTLPTPMTLWLSTGIRSLDHAVETLYAPGTHPLNDVVALEAIRKLFEYLPRSKFKPDDLHARTELQLAAWMSFYGEVNTPMGLSHNLGRRIGASYNVPHGVTSCILLPHVMRAMASRYPVPLSRMARTLIRLPDEMDIHESALKAADAVSSLVKRLGLPQHLSEVGVPEADLHLIATTTPSREISTEEIEEILKKAL